METDTLEEVRKRLRDDPRVEIAHIGGPLIQWIECKVSRVGTKGFEWVNEAASTLVAPAVGFTPFDRQGSFWRFPAGAHAGTAEVVEAGKSTPEERLLVKQNEDWTTLIDRLVTDGIIQESDRLVAESVVMAARVLHEAHVRDINLLVFSQ